MEMYRAREKKYELNHLLNGLENRVIDLLKENCYDRSRKAPEEQAPKEHRRAGGHRHDL